MALDKLRMAHLNPLNPGCPGNSLLPGVGHMAPPSNLLCMGPEEKNFKTYPKIYASLTCMQNFKSGGQKQCP